MAVWYVRHLATGANNGTSWANAYTTFSAAMTACAAGDTVYIADDHIGTLTSLNKGTLSSPLNIIAAKPTATPPTSAADPGTYATLSIGGDFALKGVVYFYGISFITGGVLYLASDTQTSNLHFENCKFSPGGFLTLNDSQPGFFTYSCQARFTNCELYAPFNSYNNHLRSLGGGTFIWRGGSYTRNPAIATSPTVFVPTNRFDLRKWEFHGVDFSVAAWATAPPITQSGGEFGTFNVVNCKLQSGQRVVSSGSTGSHWSGPKINVLNTLHTQFLSTGGASYDSRPFANAYYHSAFMDAVDTRAKYSPLNTVSINQTSSTQFSLSSDSGLASDASFVYARLDTPIWFWNEIVGTPITIKLNLFAKTSTLTAEARRIEVQYPSDTNSPVITIARSGNDVISSPGIPLAFGSAGSYTSATSTWNPTFAAEGGLAHYQYDLSVTVIPQAKGFIRIQYVKHGYVFEHTAVINVNARPLIS